MEGIMGGGGWNRLKNMKYGEIGMVAYILSICYACVVRKICIVYGKIETILIFTNSIFF